MSSDDEMLCIMADMVDEEAEKVCMLERAMRLFITANPDGCTPALHNGRWCYQTKINFRLDGVLHYLVFDVNFAFSYDQKTGFRHLAIRKLPILHEDLSELTAMYVYVHTDKVGEVLDSRKVYSYNDSTLVTAYESILQRGGDKPYNPEELINEAIEFCEDYL